MKINDYRKLFFCKDYIFVILPALFLMQAFFLVLGMEYITFSDVEIIDSFITEDNVGYILYNTMIFAILIYVCFCITKRCFPGCALWSIFAYGLSIINNAKWSQLNECVSFSDLSKMNEAIQMSKKVRFTFEAGFYIWSVLFFASLVFWLFVDLGIVRKISHTGWKEHLLVYRVFAIGAIVVLFLVVGSQLKSSELERITESRTADAIGPMVYLVESIALDAFEEPYSIEKAMTVYDQYVERGMKYYNQQLASEEHQEMIKPNVIVVMSEAFYDVNQFEPTVKYDQNPMQVFDEVAGQGVRGNVAVNIYGGGTHYSEFEFLTGYNSRGMKLGGCPYKEFFGEEQPSIVKYFNDAGYNTLAIHPYKGSFWNRKGAYLSMGFQDFVDRDRMRYQEKRGYISDESLTDEIIYRYENRTEDKPMFCFAVSMQNHIAIVNGEEKENEPDRVSVMFDDTFTKYGPMRKQWFSQYVSGIAESGEALKKLTQYFDKVDEPTIILFFGDHAPSYAKDMLDEQDQRAYQTPFMIWDNYMNKDEVIKDDYIVDFPRSQDGNIMMNASYLSTYMLQMIGMPFAKQNYYNLALMSEYPVETRYQVIDKNSLKLSDYNQKMQEQYIERSKSLKCQINGMLEHPKDCSNIWNYVAN